MLGDLKDNKEGETCNGEEKVPGIVKFCPARWPVKATCYKLILANYASLLEEWDTCLAIEGKIDTDTRPRILGCQVFLWSSFKPTSFCAH